MTDTAQQAHLQQVQKPRAETAQEDGRDYAATPSRAATLLQLQRQIGNRAVLSLLNRPAAIQRDDTDDEEEGDLGITGMEDRAMGEEDRRARHEQSQEKANQRDEGLGQVDDETLESAGNMFQALDRQNEIAEEKRLQALVPVKIEELLARIEALRGPYKDLRIAISRGIRAQMPRSFMEGPNTISNIMAAVRRAVPAFPIEGTLDWFATNIPKLTKYAGTQAAAKDVSALEAAMQTDLTPYIDDWLDKQAQATSQKFQDFVTNADPAGAIKYLKSFFGKMTDVGALRAYYRSSHDKGEKATYGFSYDLRDTPLAVHVHTAGSGTIITGASLKLRSDEYGDAFIPVWMLAKENTLANAIIAGVAGSSEDPRSSIAEIKAGNWPDRWKRRDVR